MICDIYKLNLLPKYHSMEKLNWKIRVQYYKFIDNINFRKLSRITRGGKGSEEVSHTKKFYKPVW